MMKKQILGVFLFAIALLIGCKNDDNKNKDIMALDGDIMTVHNEVMPKMAELNRLKRKLMSYKETLGDNDIATKDSVINAILLLSKSEDAMNDWMASYKFPEPNANHEASIKYLTGQKDSIKLISDDIYKSMAIAKGFLKNMPDSMDTDAKEAEHAEHSGGHKH